MLKDLDTISYNGTFNVSNITQPVQFPSNLTLIDYKIKSMSRGDIIADKYYNNPQLDYWVYLANNVVDPLDFAPLDSSTIDQLLIEKYGSLHIASKLILYWQNDWRSDDNTLSLSAFNSLPADVKSLYDIQINYRGQTSGYTRKKIDLRKSTNVINTYPLIGQKGEVVSLGNDGYGTVITNANNTSYVHNITGNPSVVPLTSRKVISDTLLPYYDPISPYIYYHDLLGDKRLNIKLVTKSQVQ